jgi:heme/copper-type cytochrome/quinol oxidase subunit 4
MNGPYCSQCGEQAIQPRHMTVRHFVTSIIVHEILDLDGKLWRTLLQLLRHPGLLTEEYCRGRRQLYLRPVRLLLSAVIIYALLTRGGLQASLFVGPVALSVAPTSVPEGETLNETVSRIDRFGILTRSLTQRQQNGALNSETDRERFHAQLERFVEPLSFTNVFLLALVLYATFYRRRRLFLEHAVFSMHFVSFVLLSSILLVPVTWALETLKSDAFALVIILAVVAWQFVYLSVAIIRFYLADDSHRTRSTILAALAAVALYVLNSAFITGVQLVGGLIALWRV